MKNINDQSLYKLFDQDSSPSSIKSLLTLSGFSIYGFSFLKLVSSWSPSIKKFKYSLESYYSSPLY